MQIIKIIPQLRKVLDIARRKGKSIGFVPTMGCFHEGHLQLMRRAKKEHDICVVSIYVNPKQFGPKEDLSQYPRDFKRDASMAQKENVDIIFFPSDNVIYSKGYLTYIDVETITQSLCGHFRLGHFLGVATVVAKLLNMVQPSAMYLGQKDAQQVAVLKVMARDLNFPVKICVEPTVRESDGLALSSRNVFLSPRDRQEAPVIHRALRQAKTAIQKGERNPGRIIAMIKAMIKFKTRGQVQYVACVHADTLESLKRIEGNILIAVAVLFGKTRLIDNISIRVHEPRKIKD